MEIPMLDDDEFEHVMALRGTGRGDDLREREFGPVLREYERIAGFHETNINAVYHHRASMYRPPCPDCGKPLRTLQARFCAACNFPPPARMESR
jgi:ribosomal protein L37E